MKPPSSQTTDLSVEALSIASDKCLALRVSSGFEYCSVQVLKHGFDASYLLAGGLERPGASSPRSYSWMSAEPENRT